MERTRIVLIAIFLLVPVSGSAGADEVKTAESAKADPTNNTHGTFNQHYPLGHAWLGYLDLVGRSNIHSAKVQVKVKPAKKITAWADFHTFFAEQRLDAGSGLVVDLDSDQDLYYHDLRMLADERLHYCPEGWSLK